MPIYTYKCSNCGHVFDKIVKAELLNAQHACPKCSWMSKRMPTSKVSFRGKGDGWVGKIGGHRGNN